MLTRMIRIAAVASLAAALPAAAERAGTVEVGAFARYADFDNSLALNNAVGVGGRATVFLERAVALELDVSRTSAGRPGGGSVTYTPAHLRLVGAVAAGQRLEVLLGGGAVRNVYGGRFDASDGGVSATLGLRYPWSDRLWLRGGAGPGLMLPSGSARGRPFTLFHGHWGPP